LATSMHGYPLEEIKVARPIPRITVFGFVTLIDPSSLYYPGYNKRWSPSSNFELINSTESFSLAT